MNTQSYYTNCTLCPRNCGVDRNRMPGYCGEKAALRAARAGLHFFEEPYISGSRGSGTVFFTGCSLRCIYCQNHYISLNDHNHADPDFRISVERLAEIFLEQQERGAHNINLVTGTHFTPQIAEAIRLARSNGLTIPTLWNSSGYEKVETLQLLEGLIDIWLPDFKTLDPALGKKYMNAPDYPDIAKGALDFMVRENEKNMKAYLRHSGKDSSREDCCKKDGCKKDISTDDCCKEDGCKKDISTDDCCKKARSGENDFIKNASAEYDIPGLSSPEALFENDVMVRGVNVRHLVLPGSTKDSRKVIDYLYQTYGDRIFLSIMSQYTPVRNLPIPELNRKLTRREYEKVVDYAIDLGVSNAMIQEGDVAETSFIPAFHGEGILK